jgi:RES domain-containing protein
VSKRIFPEEIVTEVRDLGGLPADWRSSDSIQARALGTRWLVARQSAVLRVPSVVIPRESNYAINPEHPDFYRIQIEPPLAFEFDVRLLARVQ